MKSKAINSCPPSPCIAQRSVPGGSGDHFHAAVGGYGAITTPFSFEHCQFGGGGIYIERAPTALTNCLFDRVALDLDDANKEPARYLFNNLWDKLGISTILGLLEWPTSLVFKSPGFRYGPGMRAWDPAMRR